MTDIYRDMSEPGWDYLGDPRVGLPSADIPGGSLLEAAATKYPSDLLRLYIPTVPQGTAVDENGEYSGVHPDYGQLYVNGVYVEDWYYHGAPTGGLASNMAAAISGIENYFQKQKQKIQDEEDEQRNQIEKQEMERAQELAQIEARMQQLTELSESLKQEYNKQFNQKTFTNSLIPRSK